MADPTIVNSFEQQRKRIIDALDVDKVLEVMALLNITWPSNGGSSADRQIYTTVDMLLYQARNALEESTEPFVTASTGGLEVLAVRMSDGTIHYRASFAPVVHRGWVFT